MILVANKHASKFECKLYSSYNHRMIAHADTGCSWLQILICQNLRNNLQHPNEYIRGVTLRFLCRIREEEILEPLIPSILACLEHRHSYVRRNAVLAINALYRLPRGELLLQDAPELIEKVSNCLPVSKAWTACSSVLIGASLGGCMYMIELRAVRPSAEHLAMSSHRPDKSQATKH